MGRERTKQIVIRMSDREYESVKKKVEQSGMSQQDFLIKAITGKEIVSTEGMKALVPELKRVGNNLNQIAMICNEQGKAVYYDQVKQLGKELNEVWRLLRLSVQGHQSDEQ